MFRYTSQTEALFQTFQRVWEIDIESEFLWQSDNFDKNFIAIQTPPFLFVFHIQYSVLEYEESEIFHGLPSLVELPLWVSCVFWQIENSSPSWTNFTPNKTKIEPERDPLKEMFFNKTRIYDYIDPNHQGFFFFFGGGGGPDVLCGGLYFKESL